MYEMHYTGFGYPSKAEIDAEARKRGFTHSYWASDEGHGFKGMYNGDTIVVFDSLEGMYEGLRMDAEKYGEPIADDMKSKGEEEMKDFAEEVKVMLAERLGTQVEVQEVTKANQKLTGLMVGEGNVKAAFYIEDFFGRMSVEECVDEMVKAYNNAPVPPEDVTDIDFAHDKIRDNLAVRLLGIEGNEGYLETVVHRDTGIGLALVPIISMEDWMMAIPNRVAEDKGYDTDQLMDDAISNGARIAPAEMFSMEQALVFATQKNNLLEGDQHCEDAMIVLTNEKGYLGASVMFYEGVLKKVRKVIGSPFYILPSSIHEVIIVPKGEFEVKQLKDMVVGANTTIVEPKDMLSNDVYMFDKTLKKVA